MTIKKLTKLQARWVEFSSVFNFVISYISSKKNWKVDLITRCPKNLLSSKNDDC